jgi:glycosyltransferase involved in cell wall biosynthesis
MIRIIHVINDLQTGGAESVLMRLLASADRSRFDMSVVSLTGDGPIGESIRRSGGSVECLGMSIDRPNPFAVLKLARLLRKAQPHIVQTWLQQSDLVGGIAARIAGIRDVFWNIRHSTLHPKLVKRRTRIVTKLCALLSPVIPTLVVCCSQSARREQIKMGYVPGKMKVIMNGICVNTFRPDPEARAVVRGELGVSGGAVLFGTAGRFHPQKDFRNLVKAAGQVLSAYPDAFFVLCGQGLNNDNSELKEWIVASGAKDKFRLLDRQDDIPRFMSALDVFISAACFGEGFPNVVAEAMSCGVPCVVTDVGDSGLIVGDTGRIVKAERPDLLAAACLALARAGHMERERLGCDAHVRISNEFSLRRMVDSYQQLYTEAVTKVWA